MTRDGQRGRVYEAESLVRRIYDRAERTDNRTLELYSSTLTLPIERRFASLESMPHYLDRVLALNWVRTTWPEPAAVPVTVRARRGQAKAHYEPATATIAIPPHEHNRAWAMRELVLLHELAHHLAPDPTTPSHGPEFVDRYQRLVTEIVGPEAGLLLNGALHDVGARRRTGIGVEL